MDWVHKSGPWTGSMRWSMDHMDRGKLVLMLEQGTPGYFEQWRLVDPVILILAFQVLALVNKAVYHHIIQMTYSRSLQLHQNAPMPAMAKLEMESGTQRGENSHSSLCALCTLQLPRHSRFYLHSFLAR